ncbi:unnamed protein product [Didymodactylos carnosus]|uniref:Uncharacterized protein n=1 Tax=Didymodactylos carnosus TaxID=1234261 RepID=A0A8S2RNA9_9BILA|nr:unnamed protein product [Didymodactylos carnosus]CAF4177912.1 unnamed protein product [Didymodactylos carnosus]
MALPLLSYWLLLVSIYNYIGAAVLTYKPELLEHLFVGSATVLVNDGITALILRRVIVWWTLTFAVLRTLTAFSLHNRALYLSTLWSFLVWLTWSCSEAFYFRTVPSHTLLFGMAMGTVPTVWLLIYLPTIWSITANTTSKTGKLHSK